VAKKLVRLPGEMLTFPVVYSLVGYLHREPEKLMKHYISRSIPHTAHLQMHHYPPCCYSEMVKLAYVQRWWSGALSRGMDTKNQQQNGCGGGRSCKCNEWGGKIEENDGRGARSRRIDRNNLGPDFIDKLVM
jgi:hypothetical protein